MAGPSPRSPNFLRGRLPQFLQGTPPGNQGGNPGGNPNPGQPPGNPTQGIMPVGVSPLSIGGGGMAGNIGQQYGQPAPGPTSGINPLNPMPIPGNPQPQGDLQGNPYNSAMLQKAALRRLGLI